MIKKTILSLAMIAGCAMNADVTLDVQLLVSKNECQRDVRYTFCVDEDNAVVVSKIGDDRAVEAFVEEYTEDGVIVSFKVLEYDNDGNAVIVSEPVVKCVWDQEATITVGNTDENGNREDLRLTVIASRS